MTRIAGAGFLFATLVATTACGVGGGDDPVAESDDRADKLGIVCEASLKLSGTFTPGTPGPTPDPEDPSVPVGGCWPVGTWTFTAAVESNACPTAPALLPSYSFRVDRMDPDGGIDYVESYANLTTVGDLQWHLAVSSNGQGCEGHFELGSADGKQYWNLQPVVVEGAKTQISGSGDYAVYKTESWPWKPNP